MRLSNMNMHPTAQIDLHVLDTLETQLEQRKRTKQYVIKQQSKSKVKGYSFGISKQSDRGSFTPGPGHYENPQVCPISYTIGGKLKEPANRTIIPPLGEYEIKGLDKYGYYTNSKFKNACAALFSPPKPDMPNKKATPGPGEYFLPGSMNDNGVYFVSGFKTRVGWVMDFIIFPATTQTSEHPDGQIIWIPKQAKLYPDFKGYIHRRVKKQQVFFQLETHISDDEDDFPREMQSIPIFEWQPKRRSKMEQGKHKHCKQLDTIHSSNDNSPQIGSPLEPSDSQSPDTLAQRLEKLNFQTSNCQLQHVSDEDNVQLPNDPKSAQSANSYLSQQFIRMPRQMNQDVSNQQQSKFRPSSSNHSADTLGYIPCMYVGAHQQCPNILLYFHGNAENITLSYSFMVHLRNNFKISVIAVEYPGYGPYKNSSANENSILNDAEYVYNYLNMRLGYQQANIIVLGRSIGSGPATYLASKYQPGTLALVSPFTSLQAVVRDYIGGWASYLIKQRFDNLLNIQSVTSPIFILHGLVDELIPYKQSQQLKDVCKGYCVLHLAEEMDHINYKLNYDLIRPFSKFLQDINFFRRQEDVPKIPTGLFRDPFAE